MEEQGLVVPAELDLPDVLLRDAKGVGEDPDGHASEYGGLSGEGADHGVVVGLEGDPLEVFLGGLLDRGVALRDHQDLPAAHGAVEERPLPRARDLHAACASDHVDDAMRVDVPQRRDDPVLKHRKDRKK